MTSVDRPRPRTFRSRCQRYDLWEEVALAKAQRQLDQHLLGAARLQLGDRQGEPPWPIR